MYEPEFLPANSRRKSFVAFARLWTLVSSTLARIVVFIRHAVARPAKSAAATAAIGVIAGAIGRGALVRYSAPSRASGSAIVIPMHETPSSRP